MIDPVPRSRALDDAFAAFLEAAQPRLLAFAKRLSPADAEDVVQETMERLWRYRDTWDAGRAGEAWLLQAAFHTFVDRRKAARRGPRPLDDVIRAESRERACSVEMRERIARALRFLEPLERELLLSFHRDGLTLAELAEHHSLPLNTVKSHLHRARRKLAPEDTA